MWQVGPFGSNGLLGSVAYQDGPGLPRRSPRPPLSHFSALLGLSALIVLGSPRKAQEVLGFPRIFLRIFLGFYQDSARILQGNQDFLGLPRRSLGGPRTSQDDLTFDVIESAFRAGHVLCLILIDSTDLESPAHKLGLLRASYGSLGLPRTFQGLLGLPRTSQDFLGRMFKV